jgi:D-alanyl-D-alanine carboxypeptidase
MSRTTKPMRRCIGSALLTAALLVGVLSCTRAPDPAPSGSAKPEDWQAMVCSWRNRADAPAVVAGVARAGSSSWVGASGTTERNGGDAVDPSASFRIGSITKVFVAVVVLQLVEEGKLGLDDPVGDHLPGSPYAAVTIRQLLNHTSGIPDYSQVPALAKELFANRDRRWSPSEVLALVSTNKLAFAPGTRYQYSNTDYVVLGELLGAATGRSWAEQVRRRVLDPLHLDHTFLPGSEPVPARVVPGYFDADDDGDEENVETAGPWPALETSEGPAGAVVSTAADLLTFGDALFRGDLVEPSSKQAMVADGPFHPRTSNYGLGIEILRPDYRTTLWGHGGFVPGFRSGLWYVPSRDTVLVVLTNESRANPADLAELLMWTLPPPVRRS